MAVIVIFTSHMDGVCNIIFTLPGTSDYNVQNIVNIRTALSVIGEEYIAATLDFNSEVIGDLSYIDLLAL